MFFIYVAVFAAIVYYVNHRPVRPLSEPTTAAPATVDVATWSRANHVRINW